MTTSTFTLTLNDRELAVLVTALRELERTTSNAALGGDAPRADAIRYSVRDLSLIDSAELSIGQIGDFARGIRQSIVAQGIDTSTADRLDREAAKLKTPDTRNVVTHILEQARINANDTIVYECARGPASWEAIFVGSIVSLLSDRYNRTVAADRWFANRGITA